MKKKNVLRNCILIIGLLMVTQPVSASFHLWTINEIYSNDDGTIQFIELFTSSSSQQFTNNTQIESTDGNTINTFTFPGNTPSPTNGHHLLLATAGFAALPGVPAPDFIIPDNFLFAPAGTVDYLFAVGLINYSNLPTDGTLSLDGDGTTTQVNSPTNYAGPPVGLGDPIPASINKGTIRIELETVATGLTAPVHLTHASDGTSRMFIVDQDGQILIISGGALLAMPFLDVSSRLVTLGFFGTFDPNTDFDERGLLGFDFHPEYNNQASPGFGKIYTYTSEPDDMPADFSVDTMPEGVPFDHQAVITEWCVDANDPNKIDMTTRREIMRIDQPQFNHDGGMVAFGPDGYLYFSLGDGGSGNDVANGHGLIGNGQDNTNILGSIVRIDPLDPAATVGSPDPVSANGKYRVPADNPFVGAAGVDEIFAYGLRNPFRFSFNPNNGDLVVADVGQGNIEEVDIVALGDNLGWNLKEGSFRFDRDNGTVSNDLSGLPGGLVDPVLEYDHDEGITVIGGYVYNGSAIPELAGRYVFGDFSSAFFNPSGRLFHGDLATGEIKELILGFDDRQLGLFVKAFGVDEDGEIYLLAGTNLGPFGSQGVVLKIIAACDPPLPADLTGDCVVDLADLAILAASFLDCNIVPQSACNP
jgi:glucose/arabinose dehydrogenase